MTVHSWVEGAPREAAIARVLSSARLLALGVWSPSGPHVTPEVFAVTHGRLWVVTSGSSVKARNVRRRPEVGVLLRDGDRSLTLSGRAEILSLQGASEAVRLALQGPYAAAAVAAYGARNVRTLAGYAVDLCRLPAGALPFDRVLVAIRPESGMLLEGDRLVRRWGPDPQDPVGAVGPARLTRQGAAGGEVPDEVAGLLDEDVDASVGWTGPLGPVVLPGRWDPMTARASVPAEAVSALGLPRRSAASVTLDRSDTIRPTRLRGIMLRGPGRIREGSPGRAEVHVAAERVSWWRGFETGTAPGEWVASRRVAAGPTAIAHR